MSHFGLGAAYFLHTFLYNVQTRSREVKNHSTMYNHDDSVSNRHGCLYLCWRSLTRKQNRAHSTLIHLFWPRGHTTIYLICAEFNTMYDFDFISHLIVSSAINSSYFFIVSLVPQTPNVCTAAILLILTAAPLSSQPLIFCYNTISAKCEQKATLITHIKSLGHHICKEWHLAYFRVEEDWGILN